MRLLCLGASTLALFAIAAPALAQNRAYDGTWSVEVVTQQGNCDRAYRYTIVVENGRARYGGPEAFDITGSVQPNGAVSAGIARGQDRANVSGRLSGTRGTGTWTTSGGRACSGQWNADKRG
ncbi:hypothetical protein [Microvirga pudoricolor]|uniref:hypothetical protein n=1 Tax=Microvirga pudoricolor TaxID=2778729 RepID=UPI0019520AC3|nr:hypothetical protein [Microvirga pudoricolor]MBM6592545.1 hypothetical protein [Microvirga pudoricolor]